MKLGIAEILSLVNKAKSHQEKIDLLHKHDSKVLREIIRYTFDPDIQFNLPEGAPPYKENELPDCQSILYNEWRRIYLFVKGDPRSDRLPDRKREQLFVEYLQILDKDDAKVILGMKNKQLPYKNIKLDVLKKAYPGFLEKENV